MSSKTNEKPAPAPGDRPTGLSPRGAAWVRTHVDMVLLLPPHGETWRWETVAAQADGGDASAIRHHKKALKSYGVIRRVGWEQEASGNRYGIWETTPGAVEYAQRIRAGQKTLPCDHHSGFETIIPGEKYECGFKLCDKSHGPEAISEVFG